MFREILRLTQTELYDYIVNKLNSLGYKNIKTTEDKDYIALKGNIPIVLVAHLDTVFGDKTRAEMPIYHDVDKGVWWSPEGLGADDRAGVMMILRLLENQYDKYPCVLFTTDEETLALGAEMVCGKKEELFGEVSFIIELDRQGLQEAVYYNCDNKEFEAYINSFGFETKEGTFTDISIICPDWGVAGVNLSVGYIYEHSYVEHFYESAWKDTYRKLIKILDTGTENYRIWKYIPKEKNEKENPMPSRSSSSSTR